MSPSTAMEFEQRVAEAIKQLDYKVTMEPSSRSSHSTWLDRISSWISKPASSPYSPDMLVTHGGKVALIEAKAYPVLLGPVIQARHFADYFEAPAIICVPDDAFPKIPESVCEWAQLNDVVLTPFAEIGDTLQTILR